MVPFYLLDGYKLNMEVLVQKTHLHVQLTELHHRLFLSQRLPDKNYKRMLDITVIISVWAESAIPGRLHRIPYFVDVLFIIIAISEMNFFYDLL